MDIPLVFPEASWKMLQSWRQPKPVLIVEDDSNLNMMAQLPDYIVCQAAINWSLVSD